jgi:hypothetical protein
VKEDPMLLREKCLQPLIEPIERLFTELDRRNAWPETSPKRDNLCMMLEKVIHSNDIIEIE